MMTKYQMISAMAEDTAREVTKNEKEWTRYLTTAARLYKYPFNEQLLIFAQRPDATACASLELWNEKMFCWVNRGAQQGIEASEKNMEKGLANEPKADYNALKRESETRILKKDDFVIGQDFNTKGWFIYDNVSGKNGRAYG